MVDLVRGGRTPAELEREFEPTAQTITNWVKHADLDGGARSDDLTTSEKEELHRLKRENKQLNTEATSLTKLRPSSAGSATLCRNGLRPTWMA